MLPTTGMVTASNNTTCPVPSTFSFENLYKKENIYDIVIVLNFNMNPVIRNRGSAIFIHVARKNYQKTEGCVAIKKNHLIQIIKELKRNTKVKIENRK